MDVILEMLVPNWMVFRSAARAKVVGIVGGTVVGKEEHKTSKYSRPTAIYGQLKTAVVCPASTESQNRKAGAS